MRTCGNAPARTSIPLIVLAQLQAASFPSSSYSLIDVLATLSLIRVPARTEQRLTISALFLLRRSLAPRLYIFYMIQPILLIVIPRHHLLIKTLVRLH